MKKQVLIMITILIITLTACSTEQSEKTINPDDLPAQKSAEFSQEEQTFHIIPFYEETFDYIEEVEYTLDLNTAWDLQLHREESPA